jgi:hypothetical protein
VVRARGLTPNDLRMQLALLIGGSLAFVLILFATIGGPSEDTSAKLGLWFGVVVVGELLLEGSTSVRRVEIDSAGVAFRFPFHTEQVGWTDLSPSGVPAQHQMWQVVRPAGGRGRLRAYRITMEMAQAILGHPARPADWRFAPEEGKSLGLAPSR